MNILEFYLTGYLAAMLLIYATNNMEIFDEFLSISLAQALKLALFSWFVPIVFGIALSIFLLIYLIMSISGRFNITEMRLKEIYDIMNNAFEGRRHGKR